ncbi:hypothetical protein R1flu_003032 [Riccia fluitans]|uniref:Uncharacterized protein n=1 Tax=Riccia fluitans TaxID=41844 RepID=A0ABD1Y7T7_9MARC
MPRTNILKEMTGVKQAYLNPQTSNTKHEIVIVSDSGRHELDTLAVDVFCFRLQSDVVLTSWTFVKLRGVEWTLL